jgi:hypothetical protein
MTDQSKQSLLRWVPEVAVLVTWSLTVIGAVWATSAERADVRHDLREQKSALIDHEARLRVLEKQTSEIAADVRWIRQTLEKQKP